MRYWFFLSLVAVGQAQDQPPRYQPGWPCTGKERAFDPTYSQIAEATGGHLFISDSSETSAFGKLAIGATRHNTTITRATARLESFTEVSFPVDTAIESLFVVVSVQCLQVVEVYDPGGNAVRPQQIPGGEEDRYRAGWIAVVPQPAPGRWTLRIAGQGYYSYAVEARTKVGFQASFDPATRRVNARNEANLSLVGPAGEDLGPLADERVPETIRAFRIRLTGTDTNGNPLQRMDPRLHGAP